MLTQPINRTMPTAPHRIQSGCRRAAVRSCCNGTSCILSLTPAGTRTDFKSSAADRGNLAVGVTPVAPGRRRAMIGVVLAAALAPRRRPKRRPDIDHRIRAEPGRHHADDRVRLTAQHHRPSDDRRIAAERARPQRVAQNRGGRSVHAILVGGELAPQRGRHAEHAEKAVRHPLLLDKGRLPPATRLTPLVPPALAATSISDAPSRRANQVWPFCEN